MKSVRKFIGWLRRDAEIDQLKKQLADARWKVLKYEIEGCEPEKPNPESIVSNFKYSDYYLLKRYGGRS